MQIWDTLKTTAAGKSSQFKWINYILYFDFCLFNHYFIGCLNGHENRVTSVTMAPNGIALVSCSWDQYVRVWG